MRVMRNHADLCTFIRDEGKKDSKARPSVVDSREGHS